MSDSRRRRSFIAVGGFVLAIVLVSITMLSAGWNAPAQQPERMSDPLPVSAMPVRLQDSYEVDRRFTGRIVARRRTDLAFEFAGKVIRLPVDTGDRVAAGDVLAVQDTERLTAQMAELEAQLAEAEADLMLAQRNLARSRTLFEQGHVSEQRLDDAQAEADAAAARRDRLRASIRLMRVDLDKAVLRAPYDGIVERRLVDEGAVIDAGTAVFRFIEAGSMEAEIGVPVRFVQRLGVNEQVHILAAHPTPRLARVKAVVPVIRGETRTATLTLDLLADDRLPPPPDGTLATLLLTEQIETRGAWLPLRALTADVRGLWRVYKLVGADDGVYRVAFENVQVLYSDARRAFVTGTIRDGDLIIDEGVARVVPGARVTRARPEGNG